MMSESEQSIEGQRKHVLAICSAQLFFLMKKFIFCLF